MTLHWVAGTALAALVLTTTPALGASIPTIADGFAVSGPAGSQLRVRVARTLWLTQTDQASSRLDLRASSGAFAGVAFFSRTKNVVDQWYAAETTLPWTCGTEGCAPDSVLRDNGVAYRLRPGEYVLALLGSPGARVDVTLRPLLKGLRFRRLVPTARTTPVVMPATRLVTTTPGADIVAGGTFTVEQRTDRALVGMLYSVAQRTGRNLSYDIGFGATSSLPPGCGPGSRSGSRFDVLPSLVEPYHYTAMGLTETAGQGKRCATWQGRTASPLTTQRALGFYLPLAY